MEHLTELCQIAQKYGTDKCPQIKHAYTPVYFELLKNRKNEIKKVVEFGIGYYKGMKYIDIIYDERLGRNYYRGASLKMWRDFLPDAAIHGVDNISDTLFEDERITTHLCDYRNEGDLQALIKSIGPDIDFIIDDGSHISTNQINLCLNLLAQVNDKVLYVIEDVYINRMQSIIESLEKEGYKCKVPKLPAKRHYDSNLVIVERNG